MTKLVLRFGLAWSGIGLSCIATAALHAVFDSTESVYLTGVISLSIILLVQVCNIVGLAILVRRHAKSARR